MSKTVWMWVTGKRDINVGDLTFPLGASWSDFSQSIIEYGKLFQAPLLGRSELNNTQHKPDTAPLWGRVLEYKVITKEEALAKGLPPKADEEALYAKVELNTLGKAKLDSGEIIYTSPYFVSGYMDEDNQTWPCAIIELSVVGIPLQQKGQVSVLDSQHIQMEMKMKAEEVIIEEVREEGSMTIEEKLDALTEILKGVNDRLLALEGIGGEDTAEGEEEAEALDEVADATLEVLKEELEALKTELRQKEEEEEEEELQASYGFTKDRVKAAIKLRRRDKQAYLDLKAASPVVKATQRQALAASKEQPMDATQLHNKTVSIMAEKNIGYSAALNIAKGGK